jgi:hypothetical protein
VLLNFGASTKVTICQIMEILVSSPIEFILATLYVQVRIISNSCYTKHLQGRMGTSRGAVSVELVYRSALSRSRRIVRNTGTLDSDGRNDGLQLCDCIDCVTSYCS